ncbi:MAG: hypothetical protein K0B06_02935 [Brevefilum sp.]|nr:hypothetical protein [Brevefilum sp.]
MMKIEAEIMDTTKISSNFPNPPEQEIIRESFLEAINEMFEHQDIIIVEGSNGVGKTTLLAQFAKRFPENSISLFITPASRSSYSPDSVRIDLLSQIWWLRKKNELNNEQIETLDIASTLSRELALLQRSAKSRHEVYYFVIDGVCEIPDNDSSYREIIFNLIPFGHNNEFKILLSGDSLKIPHQQLDFLNHKTFQMAPFTFDETFKNLEDLGFSREDVLEIYKVFKKPGELAIIRRSIHAGESCHDFMEKLPEKLAILLDFEWRNIDLKNDVLAKALAVIAYSTLDITLDDLSGILDVSKEDLLELLSQIQLLKFSKSEKLIYVSDEQSEIAKSKLYAYRSEVENKIIEFLKMSDNPYAPINLSAFYGNTNKHDELIQYLTPDILVKILKSYHSLIPLVETTMQCVTSALKIERDTDLIDFSLQTAIIRELLDTNTWESEISALCSLSEVELVFGLVERANTKEDQLLLLSILANAKVKYQLDIQDLDERILAIFKQIDQSKLGDKAIDIASNLVNFLPELAFEMVENSINLGSGEKDLDWAYTKLSLKAITKTIQKNPSYGILEDIAERVKDPKAKSFIKTGSLIFTSYPAKTIIAEANKFERSSDKFDLLTIWAIRNRDADGVGEVIELALQIVINSSKVSPNARDFRQVSTPLPYISDLELRKKLIKIIDAQKNTIERLGPIEDYVRLLIILAIAEKGINDEACLNRFFEAYVYVDEIEDISTKCSCLARIISGLLAVDPSKCFDEEHKLHTALNDDFEELINDVLNKSADQYIVTKSILRALSKSKTEFAFDIASKLNGEDRRNQAYFDIVKNILDVPDEKLDFTLIKSGYEKIFRKSNQDDLLLQILTRINSVGNTETLNNDIIVFFVNEVFGILDASSRCNAICVCLDFIDDLRVLSNEEKNQNLIAKLRSSWDEIDVEWVKINTGFKIIEALSSNRELSHEFLKMTENYRNNILFDTSDNAETYLACVRLCLRSYGGLLYNNNDLENDFLLIKDAIEKIQSRTERIGLLTVLALKLKTNGRENEFFHIVNDEIKPLIRSFPREDYIAWESAFIEALPALYIHHPISALEQIREIKSEEDKDRAYLSICSYILTKSINEPFYDPASSRGNKLSYEEILDLLNLMDNIDKDSNIFYLISEIVDSLIEFKSNFNKNEKAEIVRRLEEITQTKFPNKKFIKHEGYRLTALAKIYELKNVNMPDWNDLIKRAESINLADQVFILAYIADCLPNKQRELKEEIISKAEKLIPEIPSLFDQINRYEMLSSILIEDQQVSKRLIKTAMELLTVNDEPNMLSAQRRFIDLAYKIDDKFAASLASISDYDPARSIIKHNLEKRVDIHKLRKSILSTDKTAQENMNFPPDTYPSVAWMMLGSLNAGRIPTQRLEEIRNFAVEGSNLTLTEAYPIYAWLIQNCVIRYQDKPQANDFIRPLFLATLKGCNLIINIVKKSSSQIQKARSYSPYESEKSVLIADMDFEEAQNRLKGWLISNLKSELFIADGYFHKEDLWILQEILSINPKCKVYILTSQKINNKFIDIQQEFFDYWKFHVSHSAPPPTEVVLASLETTQVSPIHERWWISENSGLRIGNSSHSLGKSRVSEINDLSPDEAEQRKEQIKRFSVFREREFKGQRINYQSFTL